MADLGGECPWDGEQPHFCFFPWKPPGVGRPLGAPQRPIEGGGSARCVSIWSLEGRRGRQGPRLALQSHWPLDNSASLPAGGARGAEQSLTQRTPVLRSCLRGKPQGRCLFKATAKSALRSIIEENPVRVRQSQCGQWENWLEHQGQRGRLQTGQGRAKVKSG